MELKDIITKVRNTYEDTDEEIMNLLYEKFNEAPNSLTEEEIDFVMWYSAPRELIPVPFEGFKKELQDYLDALPDKEPDDTLVTYSYTYDDLKEIEKIGFALKVLKEATYSPIGEPIDNMSVEKVLMRLYRTEQRITELYWKATTKKLTEQDREYIKNRG